MVYAHDAVLDVDGLQLHDQRPPAASTPTPRPWVSAPRRGSNSPGCLLFALPYSWLLVRHGWDFFWTSYLQNESSENAVGLEHRWIIKGVFYVGLWLLLAGVISVMLRLIAFLFGGRPQQEVELQIGHAELEV